jgi:hypothetical protein
LSQENKGEVLKDEGKFISPKEYLLPNIKKGLKAHYVLPGINSIEAETLETIISEDVSKEEIINFLKDEKYYNLLHLLEEILFKYKMDIKKSLILLFIEEAINNLNKRKKILIDLVTIDKALFILPLPPHLFFYFIEFLQYGQIINSEDKIAPHLESYKGLIINIDQIDPVILHQKFSDTKIILIDGMKTKNGYLIRRSVVNLIIQYLNSIEKIYIHNIPHLPKDQKFALVENKILRNKIIDI